MCDSYRIRWKFIEYDDREREKRHNFHCVNTPNNNNKDLKLLFDLNHKKVPTPEQFFLGGDCGRNAAGFCVHCEFRKLQPVDLVG